MPKKLTSGNKNILSLIRKGQEADGWTPVSHVVAPLFTSTAHEPLPSELFEFELVGTDGRGRARLTDKGASVLDAMAYL